MSKKRVNGTENGLQGNRGRLSGFQDIRKCWNLHTTKNLPPPPRKLKQLSTIKCKQQLCPPQNVDVFFSIDISVEEWLVQTVMAMYERARTVVRTKQGYSTEFEVKVGVHQGSVLSPLLFVAVMEVVTWGVKEGLPWELLYADDLVLVAQSKEELREKVLRWKECMELKSLKVNIEKTKVMRSGKSGGEIVKTGRWPCAVCGKGVWANSIQCSDCCGWVHKRCSGARCPLVTIQSFRCRICLTDEEVRCEGERMENLSLENGEVLEGVRKFRYLGDMLNGEEGSRLASISRVGCGWKKFRELSGILTSKKVALRLKGKVYGAYVRSSMIYGSETWAVNAEQEAKVERAEMRMVRWICGVSEREEDKCWAEGEYSMDIEKISDVMRRSRLRWMGHVLRKGGRRGMIGWRRVWIWLSKGAEVGEDQRWHGRKWLRETWKLEVWWEMMQRMEWNGGLCHGEQKANSHESGKNGLKMFVVVFPSQTTSSECPNGTPDHNWKATKPVGYRCCKENSWDGSHQTQIRPLSENCAN